jgi:hypothetical protein
MSTRTFSGSPEAGVFQYFTMMGCRQACRLEREGCRSDGGIKRKTGSLVPERLAGAQSYTIYTSIYNVTDCRSRGCEAVRPELISSM